MDIIKQYRQQNNLTQEQLADLLGASQSLITHIETGKRRIGWQMAIQWELKTGGALSREALRPDIFSRKDQHPL